MELVSWKDKGSKALDKSKSAEQIFYTKIWEKYRTTRGKNKGEVITISSNSRLGHASKLIWFVVTHYKWL